jgi:hypothetical protein
MKILNSVVSTILVMLIALLFISISPARAGDSKPASTLNCSTSISSGNINFYYIVSAGIAVVNKYPIVLDGAMVSISQQIYGKNISVRWPDGSIVTLITNDVFVANGGGTTVTYKGIIAVTTVTAGQVIGQKQTTKWISADCVAS